MSPRSKVTGGSASSTISSDTGSGSRPSAIRNHADRCPTPRGSPRTQPVCSTGKRISKRRIIGASSSTKSGTSSGPVQSSGAGSSGGVAVVRTSPSKRSRSAYVASRVRRVCPSWDRSAATVAIRPPSRRTSTATSAGPAVPAER